LFKNNKYYVQYLKVLNKKLSTMEIRDIKAGLSIMMVLHHYGLKPDKHDMLVCPFHEDKSPSLKIYTKTNTFHCFGCGTNGDAIQFIELHEKCSKHEAILKAQDFIGVQPLPTPEQKPEKGGAITGTTNTGRKNGHTNMQAVNICLLSMSGRWLTHPRLTRIHSYPGTNVF
jgi:hypothetical protein